MRFQDKCKKLTIKLLMFSNVCNQFKHILCNQFSFINKVYQSFPYINLNYKLKLRQKINCKVVKTNLSGVNCALMNLHKDSKNS